MPKFETLMPIRTKGNKPPIFFIHGEPLRMAQRMQADRPIYGVSHVYHSNFNKSPESCEQLAATYLAEIQQVQPDGPYHLCGFSAGGLLAYEIARQIRAQGKSVGTLTLIEPTFMSFDSTTGRVASQIASQESLFSKLAWLAKRAPASLYSRTLNQLKMLRVRAYLLLNITVPQDWRWLGYLKSLGPAMKKYNYEPIDCKGAVLYRNMDEDFAGQCRDFWSHLLADGARIEIFPNVSKHEEFMLDPALGQTVAIIEREDD